MAEPGQNEHDQDPSDRQQREEAQGRRKGFGSLSRGRKWLLGGAGLMVAGLLAGGLLYASMARDLPSVEELAAYEPDLPTTVLAGDGSILAVFQRERRVYTSYEEIPELVRHAFISAEDKTFYSHSGLDYAGIARAVVTNVRNMGSDKRLVGASTITQQLAQAMNLGREVSYTRKLREAILAKRLEEAMPKERILELYLNQIFLGRNSYGVGAASLAYFNKPLDELTVEEAAFLASLPKGPSLYGQPKYRDMATERRNYVLGQMRDNGYITPAQHDAAVAHEITLTPVRSRARSRLGEYFVEEVRRTLIDVYGEDKVYGGGLWVYTSIDPEMQQAAETAMRDGFLRYERARDWRGPYDTIELGEGWEKRLNALDVPLGYEEWRAAVVLEKQGGTSILGFGDGTRGRMPPDQATRRMKGQPASQHLKPGDVIPVAPVAKTKDTYALRQIPQISGGFVAMDTLSGRVMALVGGFDARRSQFNRATQALRQPGSAFKPIVYAAALDNGFTPASVVLDEDFCVDQGGRLGVKCFRNFSGRGTGPQTLRTGLEQSRNLMTVRLANSVGMPKVAEMAERLGLTEKMSPVLAMSLGAGETTVMKLVAAYGMLANGGKQMNPILIDRVQDRHGKTIYKSDKRNCPSCEATEWQGEGMPRVADTRKQVIDPRTAYQVVHMLEGVIERGTARRLRDLDRPMAGKTGTTNNSQDVWYVGMTPDLAAGLYLGYDTPRSMGSWAQGGTVAAPIWKQFAEAALKDAPKPQFVAPQGLRFVKVNRKTGKLANYDGPDVIWEAFKPGLEPRRFVSLAGPQTVQSDTEFVETMGGIY
ncbi:MAG TPA: penicillin-binding protein 1A [Pedomonas sp.]|uniref:penicillin-binding protein 1A n=1 Tax=Pedomonas sp. TaxID=2976421 RepID=UPI002F3FDB48